MTEKELIKQCRYYKGGDNNPYTGRMAWFWEMERVWVSSHGNFSGETDYYNAIKGKRFPGIPFSLLMVMFTSWGKSAYDIKASIGDFYSLIEDYLEIPSDHIPKDQIPT